MAENNPVQIVKSNLSIGKILGFAFLGLVVFALLDLFGVTDWLLYPVSKAKQMFAASKAKAASIAAVAIPIGVATLGAFAIGA